MLGDLIKPPRCRPPSLMQPGADPLLDADTPWMQTPWMQTLLDADTPWMQTPSMQILLDADPPGCRPAKCRPPGCRSPPSHVTCDACWKANPAPLNRMTHRCKNIILPQTSFAGGNYKTLSDLPHLTELPIMEN